MERADVSPPILPDHIWHHRAHEEIGESLYFWRLSFSPIYLRDSARAGLRAALARCRVKSVTVYEMLGVYDVLIRVWLPKGCQPDHFQEALLDELKPHGLEMSEPFAVEYPVRHWAFDRGGEPDDPTKGDIKRLLRNPDKVRAFERRELSADDDAELQSKFLAVTPGFRDKQRPGIKFALVVSGTSREPGAEPSAQTLTPTDRDELEEQLTRVLDEATTIEDRSLYAGEGFGHFVILGRVSYDNFHDIHKKLVTQIEEAPIREPFTAGTLTLVSGQRGLRLFSEQLLDSPYVLETPAPSAGASAEHSWDSLPSGARFADRFEVMESLGTGGYGVVYRVKDHREGDVERAVKLFPPGAGAAAAQRELAMLRKVQHPNVVTMFWGDLDRTIGCWYLVSELVEGDELEEFVRGPRAGELTDEESVEVVRQILLGLEAVHPKDDKITELIKAGTADELSQRQFARLQQLKEDPVIHRDIKPKNVLLTPSGLVKLIDFNIASPAGSRMDTQSGTPLYSPPFGWAERVWTPQVDLFATGVILYELICHDHPFKDGATVAVDPSQHRPDLTQPQIELLKRGCSVSEGFLTATSMREALEVAWRNP